MKNAYVLLLTKIPGGIGALVTEADHQGHAFVRRLQDEWQSGENTFNRSGECLLGAYVGRRLVGIGGLNRDPYSTTADVGRVRHVYVSAQDRRTGVGTSLVRRIIDEAAGSFSTLRLRTESSEAAAFYERLGFYNVDDETATHIMRL